MFARQVFGWATAALVASATLGAPTLAGAQEMSFFRIGTGGTAGTYYPIGGLLANAISAPPGSRSCEDGGSCACRGWWRRRWPRTGRSPT